MKHIVSNYLSKVALQPKYLKTVTLSAILVLPMAIAPAFGQLSQVTNPLCPFLVSQYNQCIATKQSQQTEACSTEKAQYDADTQALQNCMVSVQAGQQSSDTCNTLSDQVQTDMLKIQACMQNAQNTISTQQCQYPQGC